MFSPVDAAIVAREPNLPGLRLVLDSDLLLETLRAELPDLSPSAATYHYVRYKPGTSCLNAFRMTVGGLTMRGYAKAYHRDDQARLQKAEERPTVVGPLGVGRIVLHELATEIVFFPNDNRLRSLGKLFDAQTTDTVRSSLFKGLPHLRDADIRMLRYKPERRFVGRVDVDGVPQAVVKLYSQRAAENARAAASKLGTSQPLIGGSTRHAGLVFAWQPGTVLSDLIYQPDADFSIVERLGEALADFHSCDGEGLRVRERAAEIATVERMVAALTATLPCTTDLVTELAQRIVDGLQAAPPLVTPIHGDFYDRQILVHNGEITILDLDNTLLSDPADDLGLFSAHLERDMLRGVVPPDYVAPIREALLRGYGLPPERLDLYTAFGMLQLAPHHFRNREKGWPERTEATLERALQILAQPVSV